MKKIDFKNLFIEIHKHHLTICDFFFPVELPWDEPTTGCVEFVKWKSDISWMTLTPWSKLETLSLSLLRKLLEPDTRKRLNIKQIIEHKWCRANLSGMLYKYIHFVRVFYCKGTVAATNLDNRDCFFKYDLLVQVLSDSQ